MHFWENLKLVETSADTFQYMLHVLDDAKREFMSKTILHWLFLIASASLPPCNKHKQWNGGGKQYKSSQIRLEKK